MHYFDFSNKNILFALRCLCIRLHMKAESQQLDRLIDSFAHAWVRANPDHGFLNQSIVYTIAYSILLLNTDIHKANHISGKSMSRSIFTENTLTTLLELSGYENGIPPALSHSNRLSLLLLDDKSYHKESSIGEDSDILLHSANPLSKAEWCHRMRLVLKNFHYSISKDVLHLAEVVHNDNDSLISVASYTSLNPLSNNFNGNLFYNSGEQSSTQNVS
ncbi:SEC7-like protein, partial [Nadsonia fulvescens var. elongata DSM 6958]